MPTAHPPTPSQSIRCAGLLACIASIAAYFHVQLPLPVVNMSLTCHTSEPVVFRAASKSVRCGKGDHLQIKPVRASTSTDLPLFRLAMIANRYRDLIAHDVDLSGRVRSVALSCRHSPGVSLAGTVRVAGVAMSLSSRKFRYTFGFCSALDISRYPCTILP